MKILLSLRCCIQKLNRYLFRCDVPEKEKSFQSERLFSFLFSQVAGLEPIAEKLSCGQFLPPVQTLVATLIFAKRKSISSPASATNIANRKRYRFKKPRNQNGFWVFSCHFSRWNSKDIISQKRPLGRT